jgi:uncharacterized protein
MSGDNMPYELLPDVFVEHEAGLTSQGASPYDYRTRLGVRPIDWHDVHGLCRALARVAADLGTDAVLAVGRGGLYPGALVAHMLRVDLHPVYLSRRERDRAVHADPRWLIEPPASIAGQRVLVVDEISSTGTTLSMVKERALALGAARVTTAVLYAHTRAADIPDCVGLVTDALVLNPWDREVLRAGEFVLHPEYADALRSLGEPADSSWLVQAPGFELARRPGH